MATELLRRQCFEDVNTALADLELSFRDSTAIRGDSGIDTGVKVFLSWSGTKSRVVAEALREWLPSVIQEVEPFMSTEDIAAGVRWQRLLDDALEASSFGILCITRENQSSQWLNFEAGAIAKQVESSQVVPLAVDLRLSDLTPPLGVLFQAKEMNQAGIYDILKAINAGCERRLPNLSDAFEVWWPKLEPKLESASDAADSAPVRQPEDLLDEILTTVRTLAVRDITDVDITRAEELVALIALGLGPDANATIAYGPRKIHVVTDRGMRMLDQVNLINLVRSRGFEVELSLGARTPSSEGAPLADGD